MFYDFTKLIVGIFDQKQIEGANKAMKLEFFNAA